MERERSLSSSTTDSWSLLDESAESGDNLDLDIQQQQQQQPLADEEKGLLLLASSTTAAAAEDQSTQSLTTQSLTTAAAFPSDDAQQQIVIEEAPIVSPAIGAAAISSPPPPQLLPVDFAALLLACSPQNLLVVRTPASASVVTHSGAILSPEQTALQQQQQRQAAEEQETASNEPDSPVLLLPSPPKSPPVESTFTFLKDPRVRISFSSSIESKEGGEEADAGGNVEAKDRDEVDANKNEQENDEVFDQPQAQERGQLEENGTDKKESKGKAEAGGEEYNLDLETDKEPKADGQMREDAKVEEEEEVLVAEKAVESTRTASTSCFVQIGSAAAGDEMLTMSEAMMSEAEDASMAGEESSEFSVATEEESAREEETAASALEDTEFSGDDECSSSQATNTDHSSCLDSSLDSFLDSSLDSATEMLKLAGEHEIEIEEKMPAEMLGDIVPTPADSSATFGSGKAHAENRTAVAKSPTAIASISCIDDDGSSIENGSNGSSSWTAVTHGTGLLPSLPSITMSSSSVEEEEEDDEVGEGQEKRKKQKKVVAVPTAPATPSVAQRLDQLSDEFDGADASLWQTLLNQMFGQLKHFERSDRVVNVLILAMFLTSISSMSLLHILENSWMASGNGSSSPVASSSPLLLLRVHHHQLPRTTLLRKESEKKVKQPSFQQQDNEEEFGVVFEDAESSLAHQLQMCRGELQYMKEAYANKVKLLQYVRHKTALEHTAMMAQLRGELERAQLTLAEQMWNGKETATAIQKPFAMNPVVDQDSMGSSSNSILEQQHQQQQQMEYGSRRKQYRAMLSTLARLHRMQRDSPEKEESLPENEWCSSRDENSFDGEEAEDESDNNFDASISTENEHPTSVLSRLLSVHLNVDVDDKDNGKQNVEDNEEEDSDDAEEDGDDSNDAEEEEDANVEPSTSTFGTSGPAGVKNEEQQQQKDNPFLTEAHEKCEKYQWDVLGKCNEFVWEADAKCQQLLPNAHDDFWQSFADLDRTCYQLPPYYAHEKCPELQAVMNEKWHKFYAHEKCRPLKADAHEKCSQLPDAHKQCDQFMAEAHEKWQQQKSGVKVEAEEDDDDEQHWGFFGRRLLSEWRRYNNLLWHNLSFSPSPTRYNLSYRMLRQVRQTVMAQLNRTLEKTTNVLAAAATKLIGVDHFGDGSKSLLLSTVRRVMAGVESSASSSLSAFMDCLNSGFQRIQLGGIPFCAGPTMEDEEEGEEDKEEEEENEENWAKEEDENGRKEVKDEAEEVRLLFTQMEAKEEEENVWKNEEDVHEVPDEVCTKNGQQKRAEEEEGGAEAIDATTGEKKEATEWLLQRAIARANLRQQQGTADQRSSLLFNRAAERAAKMASHWTFVRAALRQRQREEQQNGTAESATRSSLYRDDWMFARQKIRAKLRDEDQQPKMDQSTEEETTGSAGGDWLFIRQKQRAKARRKTMKRRAERDSDEENVEEEAADDWHQIRQKWRQRMREEMKNSGGGGGWGKKQSWKAAGRRMNGKKLWKAKLSQFGSEESADDWSD